MVTVYLEQKYERIVFNQKDESGTDLLCLLDTGAMISVWCQRKYLFLKHFPSAVKTNYVTTVSGFGGKSVKKREIWKIPRFVIEDTNGTEKYEIRNLLVALADTSFMRQFSMILCSPLLHNTAYHVYDFDEDKHLEIYPKVNRPVYCIPKKVTDQKIAGEGILEEYGIEGGEILLEGVTVFYGEDNV